MVFIVMTTLVSRNTQVKSVVEIAKELERLMQLGHAGQLGMVDLTGGTFSLSNIGAVSR